MLRVKEFRLIAPPQRVDHFVHPGHVDNDVQVAVVNQDLELGAVQHLVQPLLLAHHHRVVQEGVDLLTSEKERKKRRKRRKRKTINT